MEHLTLINGNKQAYNVSLPKLFIIAKHLNDVALKQIKENTGLTFLKDSWGYSSQPETSEQIVKLFLTYNFKTQYHNNASTHNTILLKSDHHIGFKVDSICFECVKKNSINTNGLKYGDYLAC